MVRDREHLFRLALLFVAGIVVFLLARGLLVPDGFGDFGHYRSGALVDNRDKPLRFAGRAACADCHSDVVETKRTGKHAGIGCEACHGPAADHAGADDPSTVAVLKPDPGTVCLVCHRKNVAKPAGFPQVVPEEHSQGAPCNDCHTAHHPDLG